MKHFVCDKCGKDFPQPLDEEKYKDIHGNWHVFDLCAPCRSGFSKSQKDSVDKFFKKLAKQNFFKEITEVEKKAKK